MIILSILILVGYLWWILKDHNIPESISQSYYYLENKQRLLFTATIWSIVCLTGNNALEICEGKNEWTIITSLIGILLVGAAPRVNGEFERIIHVAGAIMSGVGSIMWVVLCGNLYTLFYILMPILAIIISNQRKNLVFWTEIACYSAYYTNLLL